LKGIESRATSEALSGEAQILSSVAEDEAFLYRKRGKMYGDFTIEHNSNTICKSGSFAEIDIPAWVESDVLTIKDLHAFSIIAVEHNYTYDVLKENISCFSKKPLLVSTYGLPRFNIRRIVQIISRDYSIPVYIMTDCDTWGYFAYSMFQRGIAAPHMYSKEFENNSIRYLGIKSNDMIVKEVRRKWKNSWKNRLASFRKYPCFASVAWQEEFGKYESNKFAIMLNKTVDYYGANNFISMYVNDAIEHEDYIF
jgi:DNA topoisomerase-6 subunit A